MARQAPQAGAYFKGSMARWIEDVATPDRVAAVLDELRAHWGTTDEAIIALADAGELPAHADFATWLVLLGRDDLLPREGEL